MKASILSQKSYYLSLSHIMWKEFTKGYGTKESLRKCFNNLEMEN